MTRLSRPQVLEMFEQTTIEHRQVLLLADAKISLQALLRSLQRGPVAAEEALLHLSDLSGLFSTLGLKTEADDLRQLSTHLAENSGNFATHLLSLMPSLQAIQLALEANSNHDLNKARRDMAVSVKGLFAPGLTYQSAIEPIVVPDVVESSLQESVVSTTPFFSAGLLGTPFASAEISRPIESTVPSLLATPNWSEERAQAWQVLQDIGQSLPTRSGGIQRVWRLRCLFAKHLQNGSQILYGDVFF